MTGEGAPPMEPMGPVGVPPPRDEDEFEATEAAV